MTIPAEEFLKDSSKKEITFQGNNQKAILEFFQENRNEAFTQSEIQSKLQIKYAPSVNATLHSLHLRGLIDCRDVNGKKYWCANRMDELCATCNGAGSHPVTNTKCIDCDGKGIVMTCQKTT